MGFIAKIRSEWFYLGAHALSLVGEGCAVLYLRMERRLCPCLASSGPRCFGCGGRHDRIGRSLYSRSTQEAPFGQREGNRDRNREQKVRPCREVLVWQKCLMLTSLTGSGGYVDWKGVASQYHLPVHNIYSYSSAVSPPVDLTNILYGFLARTYTVRAGRPALILTQMLSVMSRAPLCHGAEDEVRLLERATEHIKAVP